MTREEADECTLVEYADIAALTKETRANIMNYTTRLEQKREDFQAKKEFTATAFVERLIKQLKETTEHMVSE